MKLLSITRLLSIILLITGPFPRVKAIAGELNLIKNPGFEEPSPDPNAPLNWKIRPDSITKPLITGKESHTGHQSLLIPKSSAIEQTVENLPAGAYVAKCWVKSETDQRISLILQNPTRPWAAYNYADIPVQKGQWMPIEVFCPLDQDGSLSLTIGGLPKEFRIYHGTESELASPILVDDFELSRRDTANPTLVSLWDTKKDLNGPLDWNAKRPWSPVEERNPTFIGSPVFQIRNLAGLVRKEAGELTIYALQDSVLKPRGTVSPTPPFKVSKCEVLTGDKGTGIKVTSEKGDQSYIAWLNPAGLIRIEPTLIPRFQIGGCHLRHGILPSLVGTDIHYSAENLPGVNEVNIPSTQWFVGLRDGNDSMLVAVWDSAAQPVSMQLSGEGKDRMIDSLSLGTEKNGFALSFVDHPDIWHKEPLQEDWLGEYAPIGWSRPFQARWMASFFVTPGGQPSFHEPSMDYSFPIANTKTRMWGVWFEDWNRYPFYFDGSRTIAHFEKSFIPNGNALIYFLEPAEADLLSPMEIAQIALGKQKTDALFDLDGNKLRKLNYSTPNEFMYDRPVCATTTRLSQIKKEEKPTVGVNLATHLYEFIREIRGRVDQYSAFFASVKNELDLQKSAHPNLQGYVNELEAIIIDAQSKTKTVYSTPLPTVHAKIESMKQLLREGGGDGFDCGNLDVRGPAGAQDDLCRRYNRLVLRLMQTAALKCLDSPEKAVLADHIWTQSRAVLREPTRWEPRRTLYFFEP